jgi:hypothetical protein
MPSTQPLYEPNRGRRERQPDASPDQATTQWALELVILLALSSLVALATVGMERLGTLSPHPYWIPVIPLSCQSGTPAGIAAALAATALHWLAGPAAPAGGEDLYDQLYRVWREPMLWLVAAVVIGGLRGQQAQRYEQLRLRLVAADARVAAIADYARTLRTHCESLERHIACADDRSIEAGLGVLDEVAAASCEELADVLPRAMDLLVGPSSYAVLTLEEGRLTAAAKLSRSGTGPEWLKRIEQLPDDLCDTLVRSRRLMTIRNSDDLGMLSGISLIAAPVLSATSERVIGALLVQTMEPNRLHAATERSIAHLARQLAQPLGRSRVVVSFQRDRHLARPVLSAVAADPVGRDVRKSGPE